MQVIYDSVPSITHQLVEMLGTVFKENQEGPILLFYSGGSSLDIFPLLLERIKNIDLSAVVFAPLDERKDLEHSNARAFSGMDAYRDFKQLGVTFIDCGDLTRNLKDVASGYSDQVKLLIDDIREHDGIIISILGMGEDGHTAGIFPYPESDEYFQTTFIETDSLVVGYNVGDKNIYKERITLTVPALKQADFNFVHVVGLKKKIAFEKALEQGEWSEIPARIWQKLHNTVICTEKF